MIRRRHLLAFAAVTLIGVPTAAGAAETASARESYIAKADKICETSNKALVVAAKEFERQTVVSLSGANRRKRNVAKPADVVEFVQTKAVSALKAELASLAELTPPSADKAAVDGFWKSAREILAGIEKSPRHAAYTNPFAKLAKEMKAFGFSKCMQSEG